MTVLCKAYASHDEAARAVHALLAAGVPGAGLRVLMGEPERDARTEQRGGFAGSTRPDAPRGDFASEEALRRGDPTGTFAGDPAAQRRGSFADADREIVTSYPAGVAHERVAGHRAVHRILLDAGLDEATAKRDAEALHHGRILVLADAGDRDPGEIQPVLDQFHGSSERADQ